MNFLRLFHSQMEIVFLGAIRKTEPHRSVLVRSDEYVTTACIFFGNKGIDPFTSPIFV